MRLPPTADEWVFPIKLNAMAKNDSRKGLREDLQRNIVQAWNELTEGWRELRTRSNGALTQFMPPGRRKAVAASKQDLPRWSLLAAEAWETAHAVIVRLELPGLKREDIHVTINRGSLRVQGEKRIADGSAQRAYRLMERAFGKFERTIALPHNIDPDKSELSYQDGILTIIVPKTAPTPPTRLIA